MARAARTRDSPHGKCRIIVLETLPTKSPSSLRSQSVWKRGILATYGDEEHDIVIDLVMADASPLAPCIPAPPGRLVSFLAREMDITYRVQWSLTGGQQHLFAGDSLTFGFQS